MQSDIWLECVLHQLNAADSFGTLFKYMSNSFADKIKKHIRY